MSNKYTDFELLKMQGVGKTLIKISANTVKSVQILCQHAGKIASQSGEVRYASVKDLKRLLKDIETLQDDIRGFIVPVPEITGPVWNAKLAKMCKIGEENNEILYELFDDEIEISSVRSWYYTNLAKYILRTYMLPLKRFCKSTGKELIFDLGNIEMEYDLMKKMINPDMAKRAGLSLAVHKECGNIEKELGFSDEDFVINGDFLEGVTKEEAKILLIKPTRGIMERFIQGEIKSRPNRLETPALSAAIESVYYSDMLKDTGYLFDVTDEIHLPKVSDLRGYENILICKSCLFTEKERARIDKLQKGGIKINDKDLICSLKKKGED